MDLTGYLQFQSGLCSKMPPTAILSIFLHKPMVACTAGTVFPAVLFPVTLLDFLCTDREVISGKSHRACWSLQLYLGFVSTKEKLVCSYKTIHGEKVKSFQKTLYTCHYISGYGSHQWQEKCFSAPNPQAVGFVLPL